jgi:hypothetical protein
LTVRIATLARTPLTDRSFGSEPEQEALVGAGGDHGGWCRWTFV